jgi:tetratricopeptide (TPR) repeat protein
VAKEPNTTDRRAELAKQAKSHFDEAVQAQNRGDLKAAISRYNKTLALAPGYVSALNNLGVALRKERKLDSAIACYRRALERDPNNTQTLSNFGNALKDAGRQKESIEMFRRAMELDPDDAGMVYNFGITLKDAGLIDEALDVLEKARKLNPDLPDIRWDIALGHLVKGDLAHGWPAYESRWELSYTPNLRFPDRQWNGKKVNGTIVMATEQGYGDAIQFVRYAPLVRKKCSRLVLECREGIEDLLGTAEGIDEVVTRGKKLPEFDAYIPLLSLPNVLKTKMTTIPGNFPYLAVDPAKRARCRELLRPLGNRFKVGIV